MNKKRVYISLPITGYELQERKEYAKRTASKVREYLTEQGAKDFEVITPFDICPEEGLTYAQYMARDIEVLMESQLVFLCEGWYQSTGCRIERFIAERMEIPIIREAHHFPTLREPIFK